MTYFSYKKNKKKICRLGNQLYISVKNVNLVTYLAQPIIKTEIEITHK